MNIKKELVKKYGEEKIDTDDIVSFTEENESELGFSIQEHIRECDRYFTAITTATLICLEGGDKFIGITFDWDALPGRQEEFSINEVVEILEIFKKEVKRIKNLL